MTRRTSPTTSLPGPFAAPPNAAGVVASPAVIAGELVLMVSDVRASAAPSAPARI